VLRLLPLRLLPLRLRVECLRRRRRRCRQSRRANRREPVLRRLKRLVRLRFPFLFLFGYLV
jgi:hypothetical protein